MRTEVLGLRRSKARRRLTSLQNFDVSINSLREDLVTHDLKPTRDDPTAVGSSHIAAAVIEEMNRR
jgi:hypothetical protein